MHHLLNFHITVKLINFVTDWKCVFYLWTTRLYFYLISYAYKSINFIWNSCPWVISCLNLSSLLRGIVERIVSKIVAEQQDFMFKRIPTCIKISDDKGQANERISRICIALFQAQATSVPARTLPWLLLMVAFVSQVQWDPIKKKVQI